MVAAVEGADPSQVASDEEFWREVRGDYSLKPDYINLENGYYCFMPEQLMERATGKPTTAEDFTTYLKAKYGPLYGLS